MSAAVLILMVRSELFVKADLCSFLGTRCAMRIAFIVGLYRRSASALFISVFAKLKGKSTPGIIEMTISLVAPV